MRATSFLLASTFAVAACSGGVDSIPSQTSEADAGSEAGSAGDAGVNMDAPDGEAAAGCRPLDVMVRIEGTVLVWRAAVGKLRNEASWLESEWARVCNLVATDLNLDTSKTDVAGACGPVNQRVAAAVAKGASVSVVPVVGYEPYVAQLSKYQAFCAVAAGCDGESACPADQRMTRCNSACEGTCQSPFASCDGNCMGTCMLYNFQGVCDGWCTGFCDGAAWTGHCNGGCESTFVGSCHGMCQGTCDGAATLGQQECPGLCKGTCSKDATGTCEAPCVGGGFEGHCPGVCQGDCESTAGPCSGFCTGTCDDAGAECLGVCTGDCPTEPYAACAGPLNCAADPNCLAACEGFEPGFPSGHANAFVSGDTALDYTFSYVSQDLGTPMGMTELLDEAIQRMDGKLVESIKSDPDMTPPVAVCLVEAMQELEAAKAIMAKARSAKASLEGKAAW